MKVTYPPRDNDKTRGERIIYVDSPEVRKKYELELKAALSGLQVELAEKGKRLIESNEDLQRRDFQIKNYVSMIESLQKEHKDEKCPVLEPVPDHHDDVSGLQHYIDHLERSLKLAREENEALQFDLDCAAAKQSVQAPPVAVPEILPPETFMEALNPLSQWIVGYNLTWHVVIAVVTTMLVIIFLMGLMIGKGFHG